MKEIIKKEINNVPPNITNSLKCIGFELRRGQYDLPNKVLEYYSDDKNNNICYQGMGGSAIILISLKEERDDFLESKIKETLTPLFESSSESR